MKKTIFLFAAVAVTSLIGCNNKPAVNKHKVSVYCNAGCYLGDESSKTRKVEGVEVEDKKGFSFQIKPESNYYIDQSNITVSVSDTLITGGYSYNKDTKTFKIDDDKVTGDIKINCNAVDTRDVFTARAITNDYCCIQESGEKYHDYSKQVQKGRDFTFTTIVETGYKLTLDGIYVIKGGEKLKSGYTYSNNVITVLGSEVTNDMYVLCNAVKEDPQPTEKYKVNLNMNNVVRIDVPEEAVGGEAYYCEFKAEQNYRLPNPENKKDTFEIRIDQRLIYNPENYLYWIDNDSVGHVLVYSSQIDRELNINGECIQQLNVQFKPGDGHWEDETTETKIGVVDKGLTLGDAHKNAGCGTPISESASMGHKFKYWADKDGKEVFTTAIIEANTEVVAHYGMTTYTTFIDGFTGLNVTETRKSIKEEYNYMEEIRGSFVPKAGYELPETITVRRTNDRGEFVELESSKYTYNPKASSGNPNFIVPSGEVTGNFSITGACKADLKFTFAVGDGEWAEGGTADKVGYIVEGQTLRDCMHSAGIYEDAMPHKKDGSVFKGWYVGDVEAPMDTPLYKGDYTVTARYTDATFENDTWANVVKHANNGLAELKTTYNIESFIGKTKKVNISGVGEFTARVIGENHDTYMKDATETKAALTFEFTSCVKKDSYGNAANQNLFESSLLRTYFNGEFINSLEAGLKDGIKSVKKKTLKGGSDTATHATIIETNEKVFALSGSEIGIYKEEIYDPSEVGMHTYDFDEGTRYAYYNDHKMGDKMLVKTFGDSEIEYWLRSPHAVGKEYGVDHTNAYCVLKDGRYTRRMSDAYDYGYAPAFAI